MEWTLGIAAIALLIVGLVGQGFEMRGMRLESNPAGGMGSPNLFADRRNFKWYAVIGVGMALWLAAERL